MTNGVPEEACLVANGLHYVTKFSERRQRKFWYCKETYKTTWISPTIECTTPYVETSPLLDLVWFLFLTILILVSNSRSKRNREDTDENDAIIAQLVEQNNSLTMEKEHLERKVKSLEFEKDMRDVDELKAALRKREEELADNRLRSDRIKELESKNNHLNHKAVELEKDNSRLDGKLEGMKTLLERRNQTIAGLRKSRNQTIAGLRESSP